MKKIKDLPFAMMCAMAVASIPGNAFASGGDACVTKYTGDGYSPDIAIANCKGGVGNTCFDQLVFKYHTSNDWAAAHCKGVADNCFTKYTGDGYTLDTAIASCKGGVGDTCFDQLVFKYHTSNDWAAAHCLGF